MKTIIITSFHPLISRNIFATPLLEKLSGWGIKAVLIAPKKKEKFFSEEFSKLGVILEYIPTKLRWQDYVINYFCNAAINSQSLDIKRRTEMKGSGLWFSKIIGNNVLARKIILFLIKAILPTDSDIIRIIKHYQPHLVFVTDVQNSFDARVAKIAREFGIKVVGMVRSWDNLTSKGLIKFMPERLIVHNEITKKEAISLHGVPEEKIEIIGIPHYDFYLSNSHSKREEFFQRIGADAKKHLVLFAPVGDRYIANNTVDENILKILDKALGSEYQILVRLPPADTVTALENCSNRGRIFFDRPSQRFKTVKNTELSQEDNQHLVDTLFWSDLAVVGPSTLCVDAALFDKPVILIGFDGFEQREYYSSVKRYYDYEHFHAILKSGGVRLAASPEELNSAVKRYLNNQKNDQGGRKRMMMEQCWKIDGKATERLAGILFSLIS